MLSPFSIFATPHVYLFFLSILSNIYRSLVDSQGVGMTTIVYAK